MNTGEAQVLIIDAQIFPVKVPTEPQKDKDRVEKTETADSPTTANEKKDFSGIFARLKKSARKKSASIL